MNGREDKLMVMSEKKIENAKRPNGMPRVTYGGPFPFRGFRVTVTNLPPTVTWRDLKDFLRMAGEVRFADVVGPGVGIGEFGTPKEQANVVRILNGKELKGNKVVIRQLNEMDPRFQGSRPYAPYVHNFYEPVPYCPAPGPAFEVPYRPGFEPYPFNGGPVVGPMEYPPIQFGPPPPRVPPWGQNAGRVGRGYPPFMPPFPPANMNFVRGGHVRHDVGGWVFPPVPQRPCLPARGFERPPPVVYSQPAPPLRNPEFVEPHEDHSYARTQPNIPAGAFAEGPPDHGPYENRPEREYHGYAAGRYHAPIEAPEKPNPEYNGSADDWNGYFGYHREAQSDAGHYTKYEPPTQPPEKPDPGARPYAPYPRSEDPRVDYADYTPRAVGDDRRKEYGRSGYTGYLDAASYPKSSAEQVGGNYDYVKSHVASEDKYRMEDYRGGEGYPSSEIYSKEHHHSGEYEYPRTEPRKYVSGYQRETTYYDRRSTEHPERSYRDDDPRTAGGVERTRPRSSHRTGPYGR